MSIHSTRRHLLGALGAGGLALGAAACGSSDPFEEDGGSGAAGSDGGGEGSAFASFSMGAPRPRVHAPAANACAPHRRRSRSGRRPRRSHGDRA